MKWTRLALAAVALAAGCTPRASQGPSDALHAYAEALEAGRADEAYQLLSDDAKRQLSLEAFRRIVKESHDDVSEIARTLSRAASDPVVTATVQAPSGDELVLVYEQGRWRIDGTGIDRYGQATPRQALLGFLRAFERGRYDILVRYMPDVEREAELALAATPVEAPAAPPTEPAGMGADGSPTASAAPPAPAPPAAKTGPTGAEEDLRRAAAGLKKSWEGPQKELMQKTVQAIRSALPTAKIEQTEDRAAMAYGAGGTVLFVREAGLWKIENLK